MKALALVLLAFLFVASARAQVEISARGSVRQERMRGYFKAFNSNDAAAMKDFIAQNFTERSLKSTPVEARMPVIQKLHDEIPSAELKRLELASDNVVLAIVQSKGGSSYTFEFTFEDQPPFKIESVRVQIGEGGGGNGPGDGPAVATGPPLSPAEFVTAAAGLIDGLAKADEFSGVVVIAKGDKPVFAHAYGLANVDKQTPNNLDTKFNLGSIDKIFTKIAIGQLVAAHKLSYDDKLAKFLPDYPNTDAAEKITIRQLLDHTSGVGDIFGAEYRATPKEKLRTISDFIPLFANKPLAFDPGTKQAYSNGGYVLLGAIIERVSGMSYYDYVEKNIFRPLGMADTAFYESGKPTPNMAEGYTNLNVDPASGKKRQNNFFSRPARGSSAGGGYSTANDMLKFSLAYQNGHVQVPADDPQDQAPAAKPVSLGIAGGSPGVNAGLEIIAEKGYTVIVLSNYDPPSAEKPTRQLAALVGRVKD
jgi:D-alanyl-D-alanine carboxypeptidase